MLEKKLMGNITGEPFQPTRIHYELYDKVRLQKIFSLQTFMKYDGTVNRWTWLYTGRAKKLTFKTPWKKIPKHLHPIIIRSVAVLVIHFGTPSRQNDCARRQPLARIRPAPGPRLRHTAPTPGSLRRMA